MLMKHEEKPSVLLALRQYAECYILCIPRARQYVNCFKGFTHTTLRLDLWLIYGVHTMYLLASYFPSSKAISYVHQMLQ